MKFMHIADVHLGAAPDKGYPWSQKRAEEIWQSLQKAVRLAEREEVDLLLIAGDLFHRAPLLRELKELNCLFGSLERAYVVLIAGNHDAISKDSLYRSFAWEENVVFLDAPTCESVYFKGLHTTVYGLSYEKREITEPLYDGLAPNGDGGCHILLAHGGDENHIPINKTRLAQAGFDYVALGHIHKPQVLVPDQMAYAGALEPIDQNDTGPHGCILGEYDARGRMHLEFVPLAQREYISLTLKSGADSTDFSMREALKEEIRRLGPKNIYKVRIEGVRAPEILYQTASYASLGNLLEVCDCTRPDYDFETLKQIHGDDVIGRYISRLLPGDEKGQPVRMRALYYGIKALEESGR